MKVTDIEDLRILAKRRLPAPMFHYIDGGSDDAGFVQVIQGQVSDAAKVRAHLDKWNKELAPGADGWLGSTAGVTEDGRVVALVRFESEEAARRNSDRPEQG